jgi:hypothetical protein
MTSGNTRVNEGHAKEQHYHAFLSHNGADKPLVEELATQLEKRGLRCWLDKWNLIPGDPWQPAIEDALGRCDTCVVFFGPHGLGPWHNEDDAPLFFGRTAKIQEIIDRLRSNFGNLREARFIALIGTSGSGKSSLALAGLIPAGAS